jgi:hypothetical protein
MDAQDFNGFGYSLYNILYVDFFGEFGHILFGIEHAVNTIINQCHRSRIHLRRVLVKLSDGSVVERVRKRSGDTELYEYSSGCI